MVLTGHRAVDLQLPARLALSFRSSCLARYRRRRSRPGLSGRACSVRRPSSASSPAWMLSARTRVGAMVSTITPVPGAPPHEPPSAAGSQRMVQAASVRSVSAAGSDFGTVASGGSMAVASDGHGDQGPAYVVVARHDEADRVAPGHGQPGHQPADQAEHDQDPAPAVERGQAAAVLPAGRPVAVVEPPRPPGAAIARPAPRPGLGPRRRRPAAGGRSGRRTAVRVGWPGRRPGRCSARLRRGTCAGAGWGGAAVGGAGDGRRRRRGAAAGGAVAGDRRRWRRGHGVAGGRAARPRVRCAPGPWPSRQPKDPRPGSCRRTRRTRCPAGSTPRMPHRSFRVIIGPGAPQWGG